MLTQQEPHCFLSELPQTVFTKIMSHLDIHSIRDLVHAFPELSDRFVVFTDHDHGIPSTCFEGTKVKDINMFTKVFAGELVYKDGGRLIVTAEFMTKRRMLAIARGCVKNAFQTRVLESLDSNSHILIQIMDNRWITAECSRVLRTLTGARVYSVSYPIAYYETSFSEGIPQISSFDQNPSDYRFDEYTRSHALAHMNVVIKRNFLGLTGLDIYFGATDDRPAMCNINAPQLSELTIRYAGKFPIFLNNTIGCPPSPTDPNRTQKSASFIHTPSIYNGMTHPIRCAPMSPEEMELVDLSFLKYFPALVTVHGGSDEILKRMDLSETLGLSWKRTCYQDPQSSPITMLTTPKIEDFIYEDVLPNPSVPVLIGAGGLKSVVIITQQPNLKLNGILRRKELNYFTFHYHAGADGRAPLFVLEEKEMWKSSTHSLLYGAVLEDSCPTRCKTIDILDKHTNHFTALCTDDFIAYELRPDQLDRASQLPVPYIELGMAICGCVDLF